MRAAASTLARDTTGEKVNFRAAASTLARDSLSDRQGAWRVTTSTQARGAPSLTNKRPLSQRDKFITTALILLIGLTLLELVQRAVPLLEHLLETCVVVKREP